ncbi:MAG TPA: GMC oxidoreductase [Polyangia bacterium]|nr:GMC oxidoreductase [Polyangia bacterium]
MLASDRSRLGDHYDVVIIGSGYGGAICAARLGCANARAGHPLRIALLERGDEHPTGRFPDTPAGFFSQLRHPERNPLGLYELLSHPTVDVMQGCGLGGTSLINASVALAPDREVFASGWPRALREEAERGRLDDYYQRARHMLDPVPFATGRPFAKVPVFGEVARAAGGHVQALDLTVSREARVTRFGVQRDACKSCGDCITGCNFGGKNTVATNYLPMARHFGVDLFVRLEVDHIEACPGGGYRLIVRDRGAHAPGPLPFPVPGPVHEETRTLVARRVILSAGVLGTAGILLRSAAAGLRLSGRLGHGFSGNGDFLAVAYNTDHVTDIQGLGQEARGGDGAAGPTITVGLRLGEGEGDLRRRFTVQDLGSPSALVGFFRLGILSLAALEGGAALRGPRHFVRWLHDLVPNGTGAFNRTLGLLIMGHDGAAGRLHLRTDGSVSIEWPDAARDTIYAEVNAMLERTMPAVGGTYIVDPLSRYRALGQRLVTAHPLGGCITADDADHGAVDHRGRVYAEDGRVLEGLYVSDGSVIPRALGVNPFLTISAFTERMVEHLREELGLPAYDEALERDDR